MSNPKVAIKFDLYKGDQFLRTETFDEPIIKIGKVASSHLHIEDDSASRMHAMIEVAGPDEVHIIDLGSQAGTFVNGEKSTKAQLHTGDEIVIGETRVLVTIGRDSGEVGDDDATMAVDRGELGAELAAAAQSDARPAPPPPSTQERTLQGVAPISVRPPRAMPRSSLPPAAKASLSPSMRSSLPPPAIPGSIPPPSVSARPGSAELGAATIEGAEAATHAPEDPENVRYGLVASGPPVDPDEVETADRAIEVMVMWGDQSVLRVDHLNPIRSYYVGEETDDKGKPLVDYLISSEVLGASRLPVVLESGAGAAVVIPAGATGEVVIGNERLSLSEVVTSGRAQACSELASAYQFPLPAGASAQVQYRGFTFVTRSVNAGKPVGLGVSSGADRRWWGWAAVSLGLHVLFLLSMYFMPPEGSGLSLDLLNDDALYAKYLLEPPEVVEQPVEWLKGNDTEGGTGTRHKDDEGQMGKEDSPKTTKKYGIKGPADNTDPHMAREQAKQEATQAGILGVLAGATGSWNAPTSPYGRDTALGYDPMNALGALMGGEIGDNFGFGGLGLRGTGRGGGGTGEGTIGLGNLGTIGHGSGDGSGSGYGRGAGGFRGRQSTTPQVRSGNADVRGSLSKEVIRRVIRRHINEVRFCYEQELNQRPDLAGRVQVKFIISPSGAVQAANVESSTLGSSRGEQCIAQAVRRWTFPAPDGGGIVIVSYPFVLEAAGG